MTKTKSESLRAACGSCIHFQNDPAVLEKTWPGFTSMSSGFGSGRAQDGLCDRHNLYLSNRDSCSDYTIGPFLGEEKRANTDKMLTAKALQSTV
jgi:hypothetical protein